jgi:aspartate/methionine/tyrosine aminotransferase
MDYSPLVECIAGEGAEAWTIHTEAMEARARGEDIILLSVGDPDLDTPQPVVDSAIAALREGDTHYTELIGEPRLRAAIAADFAARGGWSAGADNVCVVSGAQNGLFFASMLLLRRGDEVIVLEPNYVTYEATIAASGARPRLVSTPPEAGFRPDPAAIRRAVTADTRAILLTNPNNPTGVVLSAQELAEIAAIARDNDLWVISDEVYSTLTFDAPHCSIAGLPGMAERSVTVSSLSKSHAMTGWRSGWLIGPRELVRHAENLALCVLYGLPGFVQRGALVALEQGEAISEQMRAIYRRRRDLVVDRLAGVSALEVVPAQAGMFVMVDVRATGLSGSDFAWGLLRERGVSVLDASAFGPSAAGYIRLSYACDEAALEEACRRLTEFARATAARSAEGRVHD